MKRMFCRYEKILFWICVVCMVMLGGGYYFGIQHAFVPNSEDLSSIQRWYLTLKSNHPYSHKNIIGDLISCLSVLVGGLSYFSCRLQFTLWYMILLGLSLWLSVAGKKGVKAWSVLPLWAFFMIFVHTVRSGVRFGKVYEHTDLIYQLPYNYHMMPLIFALISMIVLQSYLNAESGQKKRMTGIIGIIVGIYALLFTDLIYYIIFVAPVLIVLTLKGFYNDRTRKYMMPLLAAGIGVVLLTRVFPGDFFGKLWSRETIGSSYGTIYGGTDWLNLDDLLLHLVNYIKTVMLLFNIDLSGRPIISFYSLLFAVRIVLVLAGYVIVAKIVVSGVRGKTQQNGYTMIDEILAWGFVMLSCSFIFTRNGSYNGGIRYYAAMVPLLSVLLCRYFDSCVKRSFPVFETIEHKRFYFAGIMSALCICQAEPIWAYEAEDSYKADCEAAIEYLRQWGVETEGYARAPYWLSARLSAMTKGEILFFHNEQLLRETYGADTDMHYMVVGWDDWGLLTYGLNKVAYGSYGEMCEKYNVPVREVELEHIYVFEFEE